MLDYTLQGDVALVGLDDGKANAVGHDFIDAVEGALDRALQDAAAVVVSGRPGVFSAGFDLKEMAKGEQERTALVGRGAQMLLRVFCHPQPIVAACTGHGIAAGALLLLASDRRIGTGGDFKVGLNETAIGMALPQFGLELAKARLSRRHLTRAVIEGHLYAPEGALDAGYLDQLVDADAVVTAAVDQAAGLAELPGESFAANKLGLRKPYIDAIRRSLK